MDWGGISPFNNRHMKKMKNILILNMHMSRAPILKPQVELQGMCDVCVDRSRNLHTLLPLGPGAPDGPAAPPGPRAPGKPGAPAIPAAP